jgi:hypothetical protein
MNENRGMYHGKEVDFDDMYAANEHEIRYGEKHISEPSNRVEIRTPYECFNYLFKNEKDIKTFKSDHFGIKNIYDLYRLSNFSVVGAVGVGTKENEKIELNDIVFYLDGWNKKVTITF